MKLGALGSLPRDSVVCGRGQDHSRIPMSSVLHMEPASSKLAPCLEPALGSVSAGIASVLVGNVPSNKKPSVARICSVEVVGVESSSPSVSAIALVRVRTPHWTSVPVNVDSQVISVGPVWMPATKPLFKLE